MIRKRLEKNDKLALFGDLHYGSPQCDEENALAFLKMCLDENIYILGMGDYIENGTRKSIGAGVYEQTCSPQKQMEWWIDTIMPFVERGLLLGMIEGNHEERSYKDSGVQALKTVCKMLHVPYMHGSDWALIYSGSESYSIYALHGKSTSKFEHTKLKAIIDISHSFDADCVCMGHVHSLQEAVNVQQYVDKTAKAMRYKDKHAVLTGHWLNYEHSYAAQSGMTIGKKGAPILTLNPYKHHLDVQLYRI